MGGKNSQLDVKLGTKKNVILLQGIISFCQINLISR